MKNDNKPFSVTITPNTTGVRLVEPVSDGTGKYVSLTDVPILAWRIEVWDGFTISEPIGVHGEVDTYLLLDGAKYIWPSFREFDTEADALQALNAHEARVAEARARVKAKKSGAD